MSFDLRQRTQSRGFTLLEAMVAMALLGIVLTTVYSVSANFTRRQADARNEYELTMMARALLDEYRITYPEMATSGVYKGTWEWWISEQPQAVLEPTPYDSHFQFVKISVKIKRKQSTQPTKDYQTSWPVEVLANEP